MSSLRPEEVGSVWWWRTLAFSLSSITDTSCEEKDPGCGPCSIAPPRILSRVLKARLLSVDMAVGHPLILPRRLLSRVCLWAWRLGTGLVLSPWLDLCHSLKAKNNSLIHRKNVSLAFSVKIRVAIRWFLLLWMWNPVSWFLLKCLMVCIQWDLIISVGGLYEINPPTSHKTLNFSVDDSL